jgi:hypothetical protein
LSKKVEGGTNAEDCAIAAFALSKAMHVPAMRKVFLHGKLTCLQQIAWPFGGEMQFRGA